MDTPICPVCQNAITESGAACPVCASKVAPADRLSARIAAWGAYWLLLSSAIAIVGGSNQELTWTIALWVGIPSFVAFVVAVAARLRNAPKTWREIVSTGLATLWIMFKIWLFFVALGIALVLLLLAVCSVSLLYSGMPR